MLPISIDTSEVKIILIGKGHMFERRLQLLKDAGVQWLEVYADAPDPSVYQGAGLVFVVGFNAKASEKIAKDVRKAGVLLNIEDKKQHCDFHMPSIVRRGNLMIATSTGGASPRLARRIRQKLEVDFGEEWETRVKKLEQLRRGWLKERVRFYELSKRTDNVIDSEEWLK